MESDARLAKKLCTRKVEFGSYDVFISHRGPDTKTSFVSFLYEALKRVGLHPFLDCKSISKGQDAWKCINQAIKTTPLALVIFSENFVQSEWCLRELHAMLECSSIKVLPIFYNIQPWEVNFPEKGQFAIGFTKLIEKHDKTLIEEWKVDMQRASKLNGWEHKCGDKRLEADLVLEVVAKIFELANKPLPLDVGDHIVGVKQVAKNLIQIVDEKKVLMLGLWGMGGIGKSTLARELYNLLGQRFNARCYVEDVVEKVNQGGVTSVQNHIMKALCENESLQNILDKSRGKIILEERLSKKPILLVLDDVRDDDEMDYLISRKMFIEGSMCIVTSRNRRIFERSTSFDLNDELYIYEVQTLNQQDSQSVFVCHAFGGDWKVPPKFRVLVGDVSMACCGVPLVLKVCGSLLKKEEDIEIWEEVLKKLRCGTIMDNEKKIFKCLRISYDTLPKQFQEMFLDIACALMGRSIEEAKLVWRSQGWSAALGVRSLVEKALIRVEFGVFYMHDHLRDMGRAIARQERTSMGIYKRLWGSDCVALLNMNEAFLGSLETLIVPWDQGIEIDLSLMSKLRILHCTNCSFFMSSLPKNLRWLDYCKVSRIPLGHFPEPLETSELVILIWRCDLIERLPESFGNLKKLEVLNLQYCCRLVELPNSFGGLYKLKTLHLNSSGIQSLPESFGTLNSLEVLILEGCRELMKLPNSFGDLYNLRYVNLSESGIESLPESFGWLRSLEVLNLCHCHKLKNLSNLFGGLENLKTLHLKKSGIQSLPESFGTLNSLEVLDLEGCRELMKLPNSFGDLHNLRDVNFNESGIQSLPESFGWLRSLEVLNLCHCYKLKNLSNSFGGLPSLEVLDLEDCRELIELPNSFGDLHNLKDMNLKGSGIQNLSESFGQLRSLEVLNLCHCHKLKNLPTSFGGLKNLKTLHLKRSGIQSLPESFGTLNSLEVLVLEGCRELMKLPDSFGDLHNLRDVNLNESGIQSLPESFGWLRSLEVLNLCHCHKLQNLPNSFGCLQNLKTFYLKESKLQSLPESFGTLINLAMFFFIDSNLPEKLPNSFECLQTMNLDLKGSGIQSLPESFGKLSNLKVLTLKDFSELKELPEFFGHLYNLTQLDLEGSGIQSFPESFGMLINLEVLNLQYCGKLEKLPNSFGGLQNLENLDLNYSGIQSLPKSFGKLSNLKVLNLKDCRELKKLPDTIGCLLNLKNLDFSYCDFQSLPKSFGELNSLKVLNLNNCCKLKQLPDSFGSLYNLEVLNLQNCSELMELPELFRGFQSLIHLDLTGSGIQSLSESFGKLSNFRTLDLLRGM